MGKSQKKTEKVTDETKETEEMMRKNPAPATSSEVPENVSASTSTSIPAGASQPRPAKPKFPADGLPTLEPWMKQTVVLQLKEVNGRVPDMTSEIFGKKMILEQGFSKAETLSVQSFARGIFYITFGSFQVCRRYWEMVKTSGPESPFRKFVANCPITQDEKWVTVAMRNPHTQSRDITTYLQRFCTVVKDPVRILDVNGFWIGKWSVLCKLRKDRSGDLQHLQACFSLGSSAGHLFYSGIPYNCNRCGRPGHMGKECTELACKICRVTGHETKDCPRPKACNLCGLPEHTFRHCPQRTRTYAGALIQGKPASSSGKKPTESKPKEPRKATGKYTPAPAPAPVLVLAPVPVPVHVPSSVPSSVPPPPTPSGSEETLPAPPPTPDLSSMEDFPALPPSTPASGQTGGRKRKPVSPLAEQPATSTKRPNGVQHGSAGPGQVVEDLESAGEEGEEENMADYVPIPTANFSETVEEVLEELGITQYPEQAAVEMEEPPAPFGEVSSAPC